MIESSHRALYWAPRLLAILLIAFVSLFALDVFGENLGLGSTFLALMMHLKLSFALAAMLLLAWRWEWTGTMTFVLAGAFFLHLVHGPWWVKATFGIPCFVVAGLFLLNWRLGGGFPSYRGRTP